MKDRVKKFGTVASYIGTYIVEFVGFALIATGVGMIYRPAGVITAGVITVVVIEVKG